MARIHIDDIGEPISDASCGKRIMINTAVGFAAGLIGAWGMLVFRRPSADPRLNPARVYSMLCLEVVPLTTGASALYTAVSCAMDGTQGYHDWRHSAAGGACAGALVMGAKRRTVPAALVGAAIFAAGAASPDIAAMMNATPAEVARQLPSASHTLRPAGPQELAANAFRAQQLANKLQ